MRAAQTTRWSCSPSRSVCRNPPNIFRPVISNPIGDDQAVCEVCGKVYSHELGNNRPTQALGVHLARAHGIRSEKKAPKTG